MDDRLVIQRAYAKTMILAVRAGGHAVNLEDPAAATVVEQLGWTSTAVAKALRAVLAERRIPAPASMHELEVVADIPDVICGSDPAVIAADLAHLHEAVCQSVEDAIEVIADDEEQMRLLADFPIDDLLEAEPWAA